MNKGKHLSHGQCQTHLPSVQAWQDRSPLEKLHKLYSIKALTFWGSQFTLSKWMSCRLLPAWMYYGLSLFNFSFKSIRKKSLAMIKVNKILRSVLIVKVSKTNNLFTWPQRSILEALLPWTASAPWKAYWDDPEISWYQIWTLWAKVFSKHRGSRILSLVLALFSPLSWSLWTRLLKKHLPIATR